jgi:hypothetical protein
MSYIINKDWQLAVISSVASTGAISSPVVGGRYLVASATIQEYNGANYFTLPIEKGTIVFNQATLDTFYYNGTGFQLYIPSQTGQSGNYLTTNGYSTSWTSLSSGATKTSVIVTNTAAQSIGRNTYQKLLYPTISKDLQSEFSTSTSIYTSKYIQTVIVSAFSYLTGINSTTASLSLCIYKNGALLYSATDETYCTNNYGSNICTCSLTYPVDVIVNDTISMYAYQTDNTSRNTGGNEVLIIKGM